MKRVAAEFKFRWQPGRPAIAVVCVLAALAFASTVVAAWERHHVEVLRHRLAELEEVRRQRQMAPPPAPAPPYAESARQMLAERAADWAPMLRTLENAAVVGVTPTRVEFDAADDSARVDLSYSNPAALFDYLERINAGVPPNDTVGRWQLVQTRAQSTGATAELGGSASWVAGTAGVASIRSIWRRPSQFEPTAAK